MHLSRVRVAVVTLLCTGLVVSGALPAHAAGPAIVGPVTITTQPADTTVNDAATAHFTAAATDATPASVPATRWETSADSSIWTPIDSTAGVATLDVLAAPSLDGQLYRAVFDDGSGGVVVTRSAVLHVRWAPVVGQQPATLNRARGEAFTLTAAATGNPTPTVAWQSAASAGGPWSAVVGATTTTLSSTAPETASTTVYYRAVFTNVVASTSSDVGSVTSGTTHLQPAPVASVDVTNPASLTLRATWPASTGGPATGGYRVQVFDTTTDTLVATAVSSDLTEDLVVPAEATYYATVAAIGDSGAVAATRSVDILIQVLIVTGTVSGTTIRPYVDGFQDSVVLRATSSFTATGSIKVLSSTGRVVRIWALSAGTLWAYRFNGRTAAGVRLPNGRYTVRFAVGGQLVLRSVLIASSQVGTPSRSWQYAVVFPVTDRYRDTDRFSVATNLPARMTITITGGGRTYLKLSISSRTRYSFLWAARYAGRLLPAGRYLATVVAKGGEGVARTSAAYVTVSLKKKTAKAFTVTRSGLGAWLGQISGTYYPSCCDPGALILWGGSDYDEAVFAAGMPTSANGWGYSSVRLTACNSGATADAVLAFSWTAPGSGPIGSPVRFGNTENGCYRSSTFASRSAISGRYVYWQMANQQDANFLSYWYVKSFKITGYYYVLA